MSNSINPFFLCDGYKTNHRQMYPQGTTKVYSNFTPRHGKHSNIKDSKGVISFGQQMVMRQIKEIFDEGFFRRKEIKNSHSIHSMSGVTEKDIKNEVCQEIKKEYSMYLGADYDVSHIEALWDLGYLPIKVKSIEEGTFVPYGVPVLTIVNTKPEFFWLTNFLETLISNMLWMPMTAATTAYEYKKILSTACKNTDLESAEFVNFQGHNFGMRGMAGIDATIYSGLGHATSFMGDDSLPTIVSARDYYDETGFVVGSVNATEHSVQSANILSIEEELNKTREIAEMLTLRHLMKQFPTGILSVVSDTFNLWDVVKKDGILSFLKEEILARDGKIVIRPDSGNPVDIICGDSLKEFESLNSAKSYFEDELRDNQVHGEPEFEIPETLEVKVGTQAYILEVKVNWNRHDKQYYFIEDIDFIEMEVDSTPESKGVIELLWDIFGGTINEQGYKVLDPHIGAIYGDSITLDRAQQIVDRLEAKGFASTNIVLGIGSFNYQYVTRDTHGFFNASPVVA